MRRLVAITLGIALAGVGTVALASRSSSGTYTLPNSPFVPGTTISSSTMNSNFSDIGTEMTDSLSRSGKGGMTAPIRCADGSVTLPAFAFTNETNTGVYRIGSSDLGLTIGGTKRQEWTSSGTSVTGTLSASGATTLSSDATVGGNLTVNGTATSVGNLTASVNAYVGGDVVLNKATGLQTLYKSTAGNLSINNGGGGEIDFYLGATEVAAIQTSGKLWMGGNIITNVGTPSGSTDAATKGYVDSVPRFVVAASYNASGTLLQQTGTVTVASASNPTSGQFTISVPGLTTSAIVVVTANNQTGTLSWAYGVPTAGTLNVYTGYSITGSIVQTNDAFSIMVAKL